MSIEEVPSLMKAWKKFFQAQSFVLKKKINEK